jgi:hypothetical protein
MENVDFSDINELIKFLNSLLDKGISKPANIPAPLILLGADNKKGLSVRDITKEILNKRQKLGLPVGLLPDGSESLNDKGLYIIVETIVEHIIKNAKVTVVIPAGVPVTTTGVALGVPVVSQGTTTSYAIGKGIIQ